MSPAEIRRVRQKLKLSEEAFAKVFGLASPSVVFDFESGLVSPTKFVFTMLKLLDSLPEDDAQALLAKIDSMAATPRSNVLSIGSPAQAQDQERTS